MNLDQLDAERGGPMTVLERGLRVVLPAAEELPWKVVVSCLSSPHYFATLAWPADAELTAWKIEAAQEAWRVHNGLPTADQTRRLAYLVDRYYNGIEYDLRTKMGVSLGELWRARRWRELLSFIDQMPTDSQMNRMLTLDEEHLEAVLRQAKKEKAPRPAPSMADWSQTNSMLATLIDAVNRLTITTIALSGAKGPKPTYEPFPRPRTAADVVQYKLDKENHDAMNAMLLGNRAPKTG